MRWLAEGSAAALAGALREVAPELAGYPIVISGDVVQEDPQWWSATALLGGEFVAKFAWSRPAALRVRHEIGVLAALARPPAFTSPTTAARPTGSTTWPPASAGLGP